MAARYFLRSAAVRDIVDRKHATHAIVAQRLGCSRAYWSQLLNRKRSLTPTMRRMILNSEVFTGLTEDELWERLDQPVRQAS